MIEEAAPANFTKSRLICAGIYTVTFLSIPLFIYSTKPIFKKFCDFHKRLLKLETKGPGQIAALSILFSIFYSSIACPIYYSGLLKIMGLKSLLDVKGFITESAAATYLKNPLVQRIDHKLIVELDKFFGYTPEQTQEFIRKTYGEKYVDK